MIAGITVSPLVMLLLWAKLPVSTGIKIPPFGGMGQPGIKVLKPRIMKSRASIF
jgi:hypothetical protein